MTNLDSILKSRDITLLTNVHLVKAMVFPVVMYGCESWTIKKAEHRRIDAFELWCWRRLLRVPWTARKSNQSILKETSPEYSLEGLMLKLKHQYFGHLMWRTDSPWCWKRSKAGGEEDGRGWDGWMALLTLWTWVWVSFRSWWRTEKPGVLQSMGVAESDMTERLNWIELNWFTEGCWIFICPLLCVSHCPHQHGIIFSSPWCAQLWARSLKQRRKLQYMFSGRCHLYVSEIRTPFYHFPSNSQIITIRGFPVVIQCVSSSSLASIETPVAPE